MISLVEQIQRERLKRKWSVQRLLDASGLGIERSNLQRKLHGDVPATSEEIESLAKALEMTLVWTSDEKPEPS